MAAISNNLNNKFENFNTRSKISKLEDSKMDSYLLRKQIDYSIANSFAVKENNSMSYVPSHKPNLKSQMEEFQKLQTEINHVEAIIRELELAKKIKETKIEDLRCVVERIADEDCFDCVFITRQISKSNIPSERTSSTTYNKKGVSTRLPLSSGEDSSNISTLNNSDSNEEGPAAEGEETDGGKQGINCYYRNCSSACDRHSLLHGDLLQQSLLFWQQHLSVTRKPFKA